MNGEAAALPRAMRTAAPAALAGVLCWLLLGDLGIAMRDRAALPSGLELLRAGGASDTATSLLLATVPALLSMLVVPYVGWQSDRLRSRWGRRRPFLMVAAPVGCLALLGLAFSPALGSALDTLLGSLSPGPRTCRLAAFGLFWTLFDCAALCALSLFTGLVNDVVPFGWLGRFYALFRIVGLGAGIAFNTWIFALTDRHLDAILAGTGVVFAATLLLMCAMVREGPAPQPALRSAARPRDHLLACFAHRPYWWAVAVFVLASVTFNPFNTFYQFYAHASGLSKSTLGMLTALGYTVSIASAFGIGWLVDRCGAIRVSACVMALYCTTATLGYLAIGDSAAFRVFYLCHVIISGAWFTAAASMPMALFPRERFVQFNASKDLVVVAGNLVLGAVQGPVLDLSGHDYRLTLLSGAVGSLLCLSCMARLRPVPSLPVQTP